MKPAIVHQFGFDDSKNAFDLPGQSYRRVELTRLRTQRARGIQRRDFTGV
jgi:hypothetical protein